MIGVPGLWTTLRLRDIYVGVDLVEEDTGGGLKPRSHIRLMESTGYKRIPRADHRK
jgi:hypothetical protein